MNGDLTRSTERALARPNDLALDLDLGPPTVHDLSRELGLGPTKNARRYIAREIILAQLILAAWFDRWLMYSRDRSYYSDVRRYRHRSLSYVRTIEGMDELRKLGLIDHQIGCIGPDWSYRSRARLRPEIVDSLPPAHVTELPFMPNEVIRLKNDAKALIAYADTDETHRMRREILAQNEAIGSIKTGLNSPNWCFDRHGLLRSERATINPSKAFLRRVFNSTWQEGGRLYGGWWQNLPVADRMRLRIDSSSVTELDFPHLHPTLMAAGAGLKWGGGDPYIVEGFARKQSKAAFQILVNAPTRLAAHHAVADDLRRCGIADSGTRAKQLIKALTDRHPKFERFWGSGMGRRLQRVDSDLCTNILAALRAKGLVGLSVHDSVVVIENAREVLIEIMDRELALTCRKLESTGFQI